MLTRLGILLLILNSFCFTALAADLPEQQAWLNDYSNYVQREAKRFRVPGYAMVFYQQGYTPKIFVYGKTATKGDPVDANTVFRLASVSKTFTGILMAKLVAKQQLDWDTRVTALVPELTFSDPKMQPLALRHIVGQSSGFMPNAYDNLIEADYSVDRVLSQLADLKPLCAPGECYTYQNALFGAIEHYLTGQNTSYHRQLQVELFGPLGMRTASAGKGALLSSERWAKPHIAIARDRWREGQVESNYYRFTPAAGVNASILDMTIWLQALLGEFPTILPHDLIEEVTTARVETKRELYRRGWRSHLKSAHYGLGWRIYDFNGHKLNYHGGWVKGYRADVAFAPEYGVGFVMLMNAESNMINSATAELWTRFFNQHEIQKKERLASAN